jgi:hypothetical protein
MEENSEKNNLINIGIEAYCNEGEKLTEDDLPRKAFKCKEFKSQRDFFVEFPKVEPYEK